MTRVKELSLGARRTTAAAPFARCGGCALSFQAGEWHALALVDTLTSSDITSHVLTWPVDAAIEIRRCAGCGRSIARKRDRLVAAR